MKKINPLIIGIDYSITCPAACIHTGNKWSLNNCKFYYLYDVKKYLIKDRWFEGYHHSLYSCQEERFNIISDFFITIIPKESNIFLEGYAYAGKGKNQTIAENTAILKNKIWFRNIEFETVPPTTIKKFATNKGNADKIKMHEAFVKETGFKIDNHFGASPGKSPIADLIDAYFIAQFGFNKTIKNYDT